MDLPKEFIDKMNTLLQDEASSFFESYKYPKISGLRINSFKTSNEWFVEHSPFTITKVPFCETGYYYNADIDEPGKHPYHMAGVYYIQEPSAMLPAEVLNPKPGDVVLDLCAAPGGKSTQLALKMKNKGLLISNEIHPKRAKILTENIERLGIQNTVVINETPERISKQFPQYFDKILVDAPCSGEGMFRKDEEAVSYWSQEHVLKCGHTQKDILQSAYKMLKPGGELVYSTCTFSPEENEQVIEWLLKEYKDISIIEIKKLHGIAEGRVEWTNHGINDISKCARLWPHNLKGEGHFVAKLKKLGNEFTDSVVKFEKNIVKEKDLKDFYSFQKETLTNRLNGTYFKHKEHLFLIPEGCPDFGKLKVIRRGVHLGEFKKNRFEPSHHLALALTPSEVKNVYEMSSNEDEWKKYIRGETIQTGKDRGWILLTVDGYPIGWGKETKGMIKNFYPKGLRIRF